MTILDKIGRTVAAALVAGAALAATPAAQAATCNVANLTTSTACRADIPGGPGGNVTETQMNAAPGAFGTTAWRDLGKVETTNGGGTFASAFFTITSNPGNGGGTWSLNSEFRFAPGASYAFVLKGGRDNVAYLLDTAFTSGTWANRDLFTPNGKNNAGLSNMTLFGTETPAPVPLPAAAWLLLGGIAALGAAARKRKAAAA